MPSYSYSHSRSSNRRTPRSCTLSDGQYLSRSKSREHRSNERCRNYGNHSSLTDYYKQNSHHKHSYDMNHGYSSHHHYYSSDHHHRHNYYSPRDSRYRRNHRAKSRYYSNTQYHNHYRHSSPYHNYSHHHNTSGNHHHSNSTEDSSSISRDDSSNHFKFSPHEILNNQFELIKELGTGTFAKVFEAIDHLHDDIHVAVKIIRAISRYTESAEIEGKYLKLVNSKDVNHVSHIVRYFGAFKYDDHFCIAQELLGESLYEYLKDNDYQPYPMIHVQYMMKQLLECLQFFDSIHMSHTDLKLENLLLVNNDSIHTMNSKNKPYKYVKDASIRIIDFGGATFENEHKSTTINTRQYRGPEVILEVGWNTKSDIWSAACIAFELFTGELLFQTHNNIHHLALIEKFCGSIPSTMIEKTNHHIHHYFDSYNHIRLDAIENKDDLQHFNHSKPLDQTITDPEFLDLLKNMLKIDPEERYDAKTALMHPFFNKHYDLSN